MVDATRAERSDAAANRARILAAARVEFAARGSDAEIKDIAARADVGVGTLYRHFENRDGLLAALVGQTLAELLPRLQRAAATRPPAEAFREMLLAAAEVVEQFGALMEVAVAGKLPGSGAHEDEELRELLAELLRRGVDEGAFRRDLDIPVTIAAIESVFISGKFVELAAVRGYAGAAEALARALLGGIAV